MPPEPSLAQIQATFAAALSDPAADAAAAALFHGEPAQVRARLALYRGNWVAHQEKALAGSYPVLRRQLGEDFFRGLARAHGLRHPSVSGDLNALGAQLAAFLETFEPVRPYPWLPDLARLEWAVHRAHYAAAVPAWDVEALQAADAEGLEAARLALHPACALLDLRWQVAGVWAAHQAEEVGDDWREDLERAITALVYRPQWRVQVRALAAAEAAGLRQLAAGQGLGAALEAACAADAQADPGALLGGWVEDALLWLPPA